MDLFPAVRHPPGKMFHDAGPAGSEAAATAQGNDHQNRQDQQQTDANQVVWPVFPLQHMAQERHGQDVLGSVHSYRSPLRLVAGFERLARRKTAKEIPTRSATNFTSGPFQSRGSVCAPCAARLGFPWHFRLSRIRLIGFSDKQFSVLNGNCNRPSLSDSPCDQVLRQRVLDFGLYHALKRPCTVYGIKAGFGQQLLCIFRQLDPYLLGRPQGSEAVSSESLRWEASLPE